MLQDASFAGVQELPLLGLVRGTVHLDSDLGRWARHIHLVAVGKAGKVRLRRSRRNGVLHRKIEGLCQRLLFWCGLAVPTPRQESSPHEFLPSPFAHLGVVHGVVRLHSLCGIRARPSPSRRSRLRYGGLKGLLDVRKRHPPLCGATPVAEPLVGILAHRKRRVAPRTGLHDDDRGFRQRLPPNHARTLRGTRNGAEASQTVHLAGEGFPALPASTLLSRFHHRPACALDSARHRARLACSPRLSKRLPAHCTGNVSYRGVGLRHIRLPASTPCGSRCTRACPPYA